MNLKLRITPVDLIKILFGGSVLVMDRYNESIYRVQKGKDTYITKA